MRNFRKKTHLKVVNAGLIAFLISVFFGLDAQDYSGTVTIITSVNNGFVYTSLGANGTVTVISPGIWTYKNSNLIVTYTGSALVDLSGLSPNQYQTAVNLDNAIGNGDLGQLTYALSALSEEQLPGALSQLRPQKLEAFSSVAFNDATFASQLLNNHLTNLRDGASGFDGSQFNFVDSALDPRLSQIKNRLLAWNPGARSGLISDVADSTLGGLDMKDVPSIEEAKSKWNTFIAGDVVLADQNHTEELTHQSFTTGSVTAGVDYALTPHFCLGMDFAYGHTDATLDNLGSRAKVDSYAPGLYASYVNKGWYANSSFNYGFNQNTENRNIEIANLTGSNTGRADGHEYTANFLTGYDFQSGHWKFGPLAGVQFVNLGVNSIQEEGPTSLTIDGQNADSLRSQAGLQARYFLKYGSFSLTPHLSATWQHEFLDGSRGITSTFNGSGVGSFTVRTDRADADSALINAGLNVDVLHSLTLFTDYTVQAGQSNFIAHSIQAGLKVSF